MRAPSPDIPVIAWVPAFAAVPKMSKLADPNLSPNSVISSAIANAENNFQYDIDKLFIKEAYCGKQVIMKRFRARAKGRAAPILKPWSTVTIILSEAKQMEKHGAKS